MKPPRLPTLLLRCFGRTGARSREVLEDLEELFASRVRTHGARYARRRYWRDALSFVLSRRGERPAVPSARTDTQKGASMSSFMFDVRQSFRVIRRQPGFFAVATLTLAIGFAAHLAAYSLVDRLLLAPPPHVEDADRVVRVHIDRNDRNIRRFLWYQTPYRSYLDLRSSADVFAAMAAYRPTTASVGTGATAQQIALVFADDHYFALLAASPQLGRVFGADENQPPSGSAVLVLSDAYWRSAHAADPAIIGRSVRIGTVPYTVIGVMPRGFTGDSPEAVDAWAPLHAGAYQLPQGWTTSYVFRSVTVLARLAPGVTSALAAEQAGAAYRRSVEATPAADPTAVAVLATLLPGREQRGGLNAAGRIALWVQGVALLVLLVALANVVNLQMSRAAQQRRDLAVRLALGATRRRLLVTLSIEMFLVASAAAACGGLLASMSASTLERLLLPAAVDEIATPRFWAVSAMSVVVSTVACVAFSALQLRTSAIGDRLNTGRGGDGFSRERLRQALIVAQVVVSAVLLVGAALFLRSMQNLGNVDFGHDHDRVLVATAPLAAAGYPAERIEAFYERALRELATLPAVEAVAAAQTTPFAPSQSADLALPGLERLPLEGDRFPTYYTVTPEFFEAMGMNILRGRGFTQEDRVGAPPVMILEQALADALWPEGDALGKCIVVGATSNDCRAVVGIVSNTRRFVRTTDGALRYYLPMGQRYAQLPPQALFIRTAGEPLAAIPSVRNALLEIDSGLPFVRMRTLDEMSEPEKRPWRLGSTLFALYGAAALFVATAGVYALLSFLVAQRSREIGVRLALGATRQRTLALVLRQSLAWAAAGLALGMVAALAAARLVEPMLFETSAYDPAAYAGTAVLLVIVALAASLIPAFRATRVDPNVALRAE